MSRLGLTPAEQAVVAHFARSQSDRAQRVIGHAANVLPTLAVAIYGIAKREQDALVVAVFLGITLQALRWPAEWRYSGIYRSIFGKVDAFERGGDEKST